MLISSHKSIRESTLFGVSIPLHNDDMLDKESLAGLAAVQDLESRTYSRGSRPIRLKEEGRDASGLSCGGR